MIIGLTGQTGAGKSTAAAILKNMGFHIIDADKTGHEITALPEVLEQIRSEFGDAVVQEGKLDRRALGKIVFADKAKLEILNSITHPKIVAEIKSQTEKYKSGGVVIDCALLEDCGLHKICDTVINVTAPSKKRMERIMLRDGLSPQDAMNRINSQRPYSGNCISVDNSGSAEKLEQTIKEALCIENPTLP